MDWAFEAHFQDDPIFPGTFMLEALFQLLGVTAIARGFCGQARAIALRNVRFLEEVRPTSLDIEYRIDVRMASARRQIIQADGHATASGRTCLKVEGLTLAVIQS